jgi:hypothetical protein
VSLGNFFEMIHCKVENGVTAREIPGIKKGVTYFHDYWKNPVRNGSGISIQEKKE